MKGKSRRIFKFVTILLFSITPPPMIKTKMKTTLIAILVLLFHGSVFSQYYPVPASELDLSTLLRSEVQISVKEFTISNLVTVSEFNAYLLAMEKDSTKEFYENQLPKLGKKSAELVAAIRNNPELQDQPMPGVSWTVANNYCHWLTATAAKQGSNYTYELPYLSEVVAFEKCYPPKSNSLLESWVKNAYDESIGEFGPFTEYVYDAKKGDPPAMKRKRMYGGSYHMNRVADKKYSYGDYEYQDSSSAFIGFRVVRKMDLVKSEVMNMGSVKATVQQNHLNGIYQETYSNGKAKVLGEFLDGQRVGVWSVWDSTGVLKIQRNYLGSREVECLFPEIENPYAELYENYLEHKLIHNSDGFYPYEHVEERAVAYSFRSWRELNQDNEPQLFQQVDLRKVVNSFLQNDTKMYHYGNNGNFAKQVTKENTDELLKEMDKWDFSRVEVKEDYFYSSDFLAGEVRQLGLSFYTSEKDSLPKYSFYFPHIRKQLATNTITIAGHPEIKNLDDYFFFHSYRGRITYFSNWNDSRDSRLVEKNWDVELMHVVAEHALWLEYGR